MSKPKQKLYLLQNCNAGFIGNSPVFWAKDDCGYTQWIDEAKAWTWKEARLQVRATRGSHRWKIWPLTEIEAVARRTVDMQELGAKAKGEVQDA